MGQMLPWSTFETHYHNQFLQRSLKFLPSAGNQSTALNSVRSEYEYT